MRLTTVILLLSLMQVSASSLAQRITLTEKGTSLSRVFEKIKSQAGIDFVVSTEILQSTGPVYINVHNMQLNEVLKVIFKDQPLEYSIEDKFVVVRKRNTSASGKANPASLNLIVKGRVVDDKGIPLSGATVSVKGEKHGIRTAADGSFLLQNVKEGSILVITYTGFKTREIAASNDVGTIRMEISIGDLTEVAITVNTGYQRIKPEQSTGAVAQIGTREFESRISTDFLDGLVNRLPGLMINNNVTFTSTTPGSTGSDSRPLFNIRGISTMSANQSPLIVVDGYPTELTLNLIDPNEIESVTILKDAAAATVYGVRASNGVIVINRKQAKRGAPRFAFRATSAITPKENYSRYRWAEDASSIVTDYQIARQSTIVNPTSWGLLSTSTSTANGGMVPRSPIYYILAQQAAGIITPGQAASAFAGYRSYNNLEDYSRLFLRNRLTNTYNFNVSGGSDNALYYITTNYTGNRASEIRNNDNRFILSARSTLKLSKKLSLELTTDYQEQRVNRAPVPGVTSMNPYEHFQDVNGDPAFLIGSSIAIPYNNIMMSQGLDDNMYYPLTDVNQISDQTRTVNNRITANFRYDLGKGFDITFGGIYETSRSDLRHYASGLSSEARGFVNSYVVRNTDGTYKYNLPKGGYLRQTTDNTSGYTARAQLNYNKQITADHSVNAILGAEVRSLTSKGNTASYFGYNDETLLQQAVDYASISTGAIKGTFLLPAPLNSQNYNDFFNQLYTEDRFLSAYANVVYAFQNKYSLTGSMRIDQSNLFGTNPKYKYKPLWSLGAAWNIDKESFMEDIDWVKQLKLRAAYGFNGNVAKLSLPEVIARSVINTYTSPASQALRLLSYANSSLRWEQTKNFNIGLDYNIFRNISGSIDYYGKKSTDLMGNALIDPTVGVSPTLINQATINNKGIEFGLHADWIATPKFNWNTGIVVARNTSKVLDVFQKGDFSPQTLNALGYVKNYPVGAMFSYRYAGLDNEGYPYIMDENGTKYRTNINSPGNTTAALMASDTSGVSHYSGSSIPTINAGLSNRLDFGSFYVFAMINYYGGFKVRIPRPNPSVTRPLEGAGTYWKAPGDELTTDVMGLAAFSSSNSNNAYNFSDKYVVNGDYITLADLTVSYSFDRSNFIKKIGLKHFEIKAQASNILTVGLNRDNFSMATGSYQKRYLTPTYTLALFTNF